MSTTTTQHNNGDETMIKAQPKPTKDAAEAAREAIRVALRGGRV